MKKEPASACCSRICMLAVQDGTQDLPRMRGRPDRVLPRNPRCVLHYSEKLPKSLFVLAFHSDTAHAATSTPTRLRLFDPAILRFMAFVDRTHSTCRNLGQAIGGPEP